MLQFLVNHYFEESFSTYTSKEAVKQGDRSITYAELNHFANAIAASFVQRGLKKGDKIGLLCPVSPEAIAIMLACLRYGIIYVPLNIFAPIDWLQNVVSKASLDGIVIDDKFVAHKDALQKQIGSSHFYTIINDGNNASVLDTKGESLLQNTVLGIPPTPSMLADDLACILFTSGSTGDPKGIMISHRNIYTFTEWMKVFFNVTHNERVLSRAPLQFDLSEFDIYTTLSAGGTIVIAPRDFSEEPSDIVDLMRKEEITAIYTVPSAYIRLLHKGKLDRDVPTLRLACYAGEPFPTPYLREVMKALPNTQFWNIYGPTETNIVTYYHITSPPTTDDPIPIGKPVFDTEVVILDEQQKPIKQGEIGEIVVRGGTVFRGYLDNADLTKERLIRCDWHTCPDIFCRTGDLGRILPDGNIAYHGRMDNMVKTRGYRVEIDEVENALSAIADVSQATVVAVPHKNYTNALHAFVQLKTPESSLEDIETKLKSKLPVYMIPYRFHPIDSFPKTSTAKVDRVLLRKIAIESSNES
jgi:amino acid adenylation domain-containing protein